MGIKQLQEIHEDNEPWFAAASLQSHRKLTDALSFAELRRFDEWFEKSP